MAKTLIPEMMEDIETGVINTIGMEDFLLRLLLNVIVVLGIVHFLYYRRSKRSDYYFTYVIIALSTFMIVALLGSVKLKTGFALGLFAIFSIIRYRTESMPVREMTYLFAIVAISVVNALAGEEVGWLGLVTINAIFIVAIALAELTRKMRHLACKYVKYDRIDLILPARRQEMIADLETRLGVKVHKVDVGTVNFLKDMAVLKVWYEPTDGNEDNTVDEISKIPQF